MRAVCLLANTVGLQTAFIPSQGRDCGINTKSRESEGDKMKVSKGIVLEPFIKGSVYVMPLEESDHPDVIADRVDTKCASSMKRLRSEFGNNKVVGIKLIDEKVKSEFYNYSRNINASCRAFDTYIEESNKLIAIKNYKRKYGYRSFDLQNRLDAFYQVVARLEMMYRIFEDSNFSSSSPEIKTFGGAIREGIGDKKALRLVFRNHIDGQYELKREIRKYVLRTMQRVYDEYLFIFIGIKPKRIQVVSEIGSYGKVNVKTTKK